VPNSVFAIIRLAITGAKVCAWATSSIISRGNKSSDRNGAGMHNPWTVAVVSLLLLGCATTQDTSFAPQGTSLAPYTLSGSEIAAVEDGVRSARHDLDNPAFRGFAANQHEDGQINVCGWLRPNGNSSEQPFIGTLFEGTFAPEHFGGNKTDDAQIFSDCQNRGAGIA
jgi:hypothetical protein